MARFDDGADRRLRGRACGRISLPLQLSSRTYILLRLSLRLRRWSRRVSRKSDRKTGASGAEESPHGYGAAASAPPSPVVVIADPLRILREPLQRSSVVSASRRRCGRIFYGGRRPGTRPPHTTRNVPARGVASATRSGTFAPLLSLPSSPGRRLLSAIARLPATPRGTPGHRILSPETIAGTANDALRRYSRGSPSLSGGL